MNMRLFYHAKAMLSSSNGEGIATSGVVGASKTAIGFSVMASAAGAVAVIPGLGGAVAGRAVQSSTIMIAPGAGSHRRGERSCKQGHDHQGAEEQGNELLHD